MKVGNFLSRMERLYFDHQNQAPLRESVRRAIDQALEQVGNPSSLHAEGRGAAQWVQRARAQVAALVGARPEEVFFTSSATEANTWALWGLCEAHAARGNHLIVSAVEHLSILQTVRRMEKRGWEATVVPVDRFGRVEPDRLEAALNPRTVLVCVQWANGEVGTIQPIAELARRVKAKGVLFHSDAVAAAGRVPIDWPTCGLDALTLAANALGGPPGAGALVLRKGTRIQPLLVGGAQEEGRRAGTENLLGIVGMGEASRASAEELPRLKDRLAPLRDHLLRGILNKSPEAQLNGHPTERLPGHLSVSFPDLDAESLVLALDLRGVAAGLGSACTAQTRKASHVLRAMGVEEETALGTVVFTFGPQVAESQIAELLNRLQGVLSSVRGLKVTA